MKSKNSSYYDRLRKKEWKYTANFGPSTRIRYKIILNLLGKYSKKNFRILDCGCGSGNLLRLLDKKRYKNLTGSDFSNESVILSKKISGKNIFKADLTKIKDFKNKKFDVVICSEILEHIEKDTLAIKNIRLILNDEGIVIFSVPFNVIYWSQHDDFSGHVRRYNGMELEKKLEKQNFDILESWGWGSLFYPIYHRLLTRNKPTSLMNNKNNIFKKSISKILYFTFSIEKISKSKKRARRLFVVARKK